MILEKLLDLLLDGLERLLDLFEYLGVPTITWPGPLNIVAPVPVLSTGLLASINQWLVVAPIVGGCLMVGKCLQWLYSKIPFV